MSRWLKRNAKDRCEIDATAARPPGGSCPRGDLSAQSVVEVCRYRFKEWSARVRDGSKKQAGFGTSHDR